VLVDAAPPLLRIVRGQLGLGLRLRLRCHRDGALGELRPQLLRPRIGRRGGGRSGGRGMGAAAAERLGRGGSSRHARQPGEEASHRGDATLAAASCSVIAPFRPERRRQAGPIQTVGRKEVIGTLTTYEILLMLDPELPEERQDEIILRVRELVEKAGGTWRSHDAWGRRRLAYEIAKKSEGVYHLVVFESEAATLDEIVRVLKIDDGVMRHMATKHIEGSKTSAPRDDSAAPIPVPLAEPEPAPELEPAAVAVPAPEDPETTIVPDEE
jgi:small subunit ribosomal protein S6